MVIVLLVLLLFLLGFRVWGLALKMGVSHCSRGPPNSIDLPTSMTPSELQIPYGACKELEFSGPTLY